jgi:hypothetical protein
MCGVANQRGESTAHLEVTITRGDLDDIIDALQGAEEQLKMARELELDTRMIRKRMEQIRHELEPVTKRHPTPYPGLTQETTIVRLPADWPDKPRGG